MVKGSKRLEEAKKKMSEAKKGKHYSPETEFKKGHKVNLGRKLSEEEKRKICKGWFEKGGVPWIKGRRIPVEIKRK